MLADPVAGHAPRISLILHKFSRGGSDRVAAYLARGFADAGLDVDMIVFSRGGEAESILSDMVGEDVPICYLGRAGASRALDLVRGLPKFVRLLRARAPDVVISTANNTALTTAIAVRLAGLRQCKLVLKTTNPVASSRHKGFARQIRLWTYRVIFGWTNAVWTLSSDESEEMREEFPDFSSIFRDVANPYVTPEMLIPPSAVEGRRKGKTIVSIARLTAQKRLDRLIAAFAHVRSKDTKLLILGEGEDRAILSDQIAHLGLKDRVFMPGYVEDVSAVLHSSDLFVLTSDYEGFPAALLEAMAGNCAVLSTDSFPAARSLLGAIEGGGIIENTDPAALGALMDQYLEKPRPTALRSIAEHYSVENGISSHLTALTTLQ